MNRVMILGAALLAGTALAAQGTPGKAATGEAAAIPTFSGAWQSAHDRKFIVPASGPGPVVDDPAHPHQGRGRNAAGKDTGTTPWVGNWHNPNLLTWTAAAVKKAGDDGLAGHARPTAESTCYPAGVPGILNFFEPVFFLQTPKEVTILYQRGPNIRHIYLNTKHSAHPTPSWYGESVGHYEGDTLVVDTIGFNDKTVLDEYDTPHTEALHVVERYKLTNGGKGIEVNFTIDDPKAFKQPWSAIGRYRKVNQKGLEESICAENNTDLFTGKLFPIPVAAKPDF